ASARDKDASVRANRLGLARWNRQPVRRPARCPRAAQGSAREDPLLPLAPRQNPANAAPTPTAAHYPKSSSHLPQFSRHPLPHTGGKKHSAATPACVRNRASKAERAAARHTRESTGRGAHARSQSQRRTSSPPPSALPSARKARLECLL